MKPEGKSGKNIDTWIRRLFLDNRALGGLFALTAIGLSIFSWGYSIPQEGIDMYFMLAIFALVAQNAADSIGNKRGAKQRG